MTETMSGNISEEDVVQFLMREPDFFERHTDLLTAIHLTSPYGSRAISLQERQAEMLREKIRVYERRILEIMRYSNENLLLTDKLLMWARQLFQVSHPAELPTVLVNGLKTQFNVPQAAIRVWGVSERYRSESFAQDVDENGRSFATSLSSPYCGVNAGFDAIGWLGEPEAALSVALVALRENPQESAFGLLVLASPDSQRYEAGMATDLLERLGQLASAALTRLREK